MADLPPAGSQGPALVSVTIPFLNGERFLAEAIDSVLAQTYTHWELFLVDDGSADNSTAIARQYAMRFPDTIHYLEHPGHRNCGLPASRNRGVRAGAGEYLAFLDADDVWLPGKLEEQVALMEAHPEVGLLYGHSQYWYDWDASRSPLAQNEIPPLVPAGKVYHPPELLTACYPVGEAEAPCPSSFMVRRSLMSRVGGFEEQFSAGTYQLYEDQAFLAKVYLNAPVYVSEQCWVKYRCHAQSMGSMAQESGRAEAERRFYFRWLYRYLRRHDVRDPGIWAAVRKRAWEYEYPLPLTAAKLLRRFGRFLTFR